MPEWIVLISIGIGSILFLLLPSFGRRWSLSSMEYLLVAAGAGFLYFGYPLLVAATHLQTWAHHFQSCGGGLFPCSVSGFFGQTQFLFPVFWSLGWATLALYTLGRWIQNHQRIRRLLHSLSPRTVGPVTARILPWPEPFLGLIGVWKPQLVVSEGALEVFSQEDLRAAILHEEAHRRLRHNFKDLALRLLISGLPGRLRSSLYEGYVYLREVEADRRVPTPTALASALLKATHAPKVEYGLTLYSHTPILKSRLEYLLGVSTPPSPWSPRPLVGRLALLLVFMIVPALGFYHLQQDSLMASQNSVEVCPALVATCCVSPSS